MKHINCVFEKRLEALLYWLFFHKDGVVFEADHVFVWGCHDGVWEARIDQTLATVRALHLLLCSNDP